jgi:acyl-CoA thioester hydrolase
MPAHRTQVQMRFGDTDAYGHVNNASFAAYAEVARLDFLLCLGKAVRSLILANLSIDFRRQLTFGESVHVETWVERLGRTSITMRQTVHGDNKLAADVKSVVVLFDYSSGQATELTSDIRDAMAPFKLKKPEV